MIVNLTYFKKQWPGFSSFGITNCRASSPNPRRTLYTLTALQFWLQLLSIIFLASCVLSQWYSDQFHKFSHLNPNGYRFVKFNYHASIVFQISDFIVSVYASFHLRNATSLYNNIQDVRIWIVVNNIYLLWTLTCFIFSSNTCESSIEICIRATTVGLFACYKVYIVYEIYKNDKSSYIFLEQGSMFTNDSSKLSNNGNQPSIPGVGRPVILEVLTEVEEQEKF
ncbi:uncharacterized protein LOC112690550 [Sipha flava]|uniref:Uncharacterized protein LOC112690550 n=1 Tax=Sipha flava TaxID=143950 RepID=A0A8B8GC42_9HEMI|nr:uncharacterized protein LOC112690550 [Sipha flava]